MKKINVNQYSPFSFFVCGELQVTGLQVAGSFPGASWYVFLRLLIFCLLGNIHVDYRGIVFL